MKLDAAEAEEYGPFGAPLFDGPEARALRRVGVIDVGSNSVRLVVFDGAARSPAYFFNEKILCGLGAGLAETGLLNPRGRERALVALRRFAILARGMEVNSLTAVATAAVREARDGPAFEAEVEQSTGLKLWVIDGAEEARLSAQGVLLGWPEAKGLICDIGGSSMELAVLPGEGRVGATVSGKLGPLKLQDVKTKSARRDEIDAGVRAMAEALGQDRTEKLFLVGGSWRAIARIDMQRRNYPLHVLHEYTMTPNDLRATIKLIESADMDALRQETGTSEARMSLVPIAAEVLSRVVKTFRPKEIAVSSYGIREGLLYERMPEVLRARDPLIESCRASEAASARLPGFGRVLYRFISPLFSRVGDRRLRLIRACCLLHDVSWRAHPDYRAEICFDNATRANLGGLTHSERVYLGLALLHRYRNKREGTPFMALAPLLGEADTRQAEVVGKAMRFGAMFSAQDPGLMGSMKLYPKKAELELSLPRGDGEALFGEVADARFKSLASSLGCTPTVKVLRE
ncbi:Ppx/GppA family phosphatase [Jannaschia formosa]|uniref:Ppx/GppA family phosphatase n=1 Tax=Jannaschia formosa TaxID=2259592 RepID=UPI000E1B5B1F|nr:Ppx/GppA family phosphatase [Jannaschia formosa]TFL17933.1 Ppx/GppA family phosphatase [Jannaschia formosa]